MPPAADAEPRSPTPLLAARSLVVADANDGDGSADAADATADDHGGATLSLRVPCCVRLRWWRGVPAVSLLPARLRLPAGLHRDPLFLGNVLNLALMILYTLLDFFRAWDASNAELVSAGLILLAFGFVLDSALYLAVWGAPAEWPAVTSPAIAAELLNVLGSCLYAVTSVLYLYEASSAVDTNVVFGMEAVSTLVFLVDGVLYFVAWYEAPAKKERGRGCDWRDLDLWANLLNVAPAIIYVVAAANGLLLHFSSRSGLVEALLPPLMSPSSSPSPWQLPTALPAAPLLMPLPLPLPVPAALNLLAPRLPARFASPSPRSPLPSPSSALSPLPSQSPLALSVALGRRLGPGLGEEWSPTRPSIVLREMARVFVWGDLIWTIDAVLFLVAWARDSMSLDFDEDGGDGDDGGSSSQDGDSGAAGAGADADNLLFADTLGEGGRGKSGRGLSASLLGRLQ